jgi:hypothetical protein
LLTAALHRWIIVNRDLQNKIKTDEKIVAVKTKLRCDSEGASLVRWRQPKQTLDWFKIYLKEIKIDGE